MVGVSSMPVREAFQILAADGLIQVRPNKGAVVLGINEQTIREHYEIRAYWKVKRWRKLLVQGPIFHASPGSLCRREGAGRQ
jgi:DNA-binding transcriptional regulator YhcF (GntR family)